MKWNRLGRSIYISLALVAIAAVTMTSGCGSANGSDTDGSPKVLSAPQAKRLLLQLPYRYEWHDVELPEGASGALAGTAIGKHHTVVHFGISFGTEPDAVPVPPAGLLTPYYYYGGGFVFNDDLEVPGKGETVHPGKQFHTAAQWYEANLMEVEMSEKLCKATTGKVCPV